VFGAQIYIFFGPTNGLTQLGEEAVKKLLLLH
jgi:hypothetical protein